MARTTVMFWSLVVEIILSPSLVHGQHIGFSGSNVVGVQELAQGGTGLDDLPLLDHFDLSFQRNDHHILDIVAFPPSASGSGFVNFSDDSSNAYRYALDWRLLSPELEPLTVSAVSGKCAGKKCKAQLDHHQGNNGGVFVLIGFRLTFDNGDHHIDIIGVREDDDELIVEFSDKNGDDDFGWYVEFAYIPPHRVNSTATVSRRGAQGAASASTGMNPDVVIGGFRFDFEKNDHHIRDFAVDTRAGHTVSVKYNDKNSDDDYDWVVDLVELN